MSGLILVAGLGFGRQVVKWWRAPGPGGGNSVGPPATATDLGDAVQPHVLQFGDHSWAIVRQTVVASRKEATRSLRDLCRKAAQIAGLPDDALGPAEQRFLQRISSSKPVEEEPGGWRLYELDDAFPMVVGVRTAEMGPESSGVLLGNRTISGSFPLSNAKGAASRPPFPSPAVALAGLRVVTWGIAVPGGPQEWTVYAFHSATASGGDGSLGVSLPPNCRMILSMEVAGGGVMTFKGPLQGEDYKAFFDSWCHEHGWRTGEGWRQQGPAWNLHGTDKAGGSLDVHFREESGELSGMVLLTPRSPGTSDDKRP